jgi:hypothetical protein
MMSKKKSRAIQAEMAALLAQLPGRSSRAWLEREIKAAQGDPERDAETLEMLRVALAQARGKGPRRTKRHRTASD